MGLLPRTRRITGSISTDGEELVGRAPRAAAVHPGQQDRDDLPGPDDRRSTRSTPWAGRWPRPCLTHHDVSKQQAWDRAVELLDLVGIPQPGGPGQGLPARVLRRHAPAGDDRHGHRQRPGRHHRRRAHDGPRRHRAGPDPGGAREDQGRDPGRHHPHHPRPRRGRRHGRPDAWSCTPARSWSRAGRRRLLRSPACRTPSGCSGRSRGRTPRTAAAPPIHGRAAVAASTSRPVARSRPAARWPARTASRPSPTLAPTTSVEHLAACYFSDELAALDDPRVLFAAPSAAVTDAVPSPAPPVVADACWPPRGLLRGHRPGQALPDPRWRVRTPHGRPRCRPCRACRFDSRPGETLGLVGESGCGKSTTGRADPAAAPAHVGLGAVRGRRADDARRTSRCGRCGGTCRSSSRIPTRRSNPRMPVNDIIAEPLKVHGT